MNAIFTEFDSIIDVVKKFPDEEACITYLEGIRWADGITSPFDEYSKIYVCNKHRYRCKNTGKYFNVRTGTIFDNTKIPLQMWFMAIYLVTSSKKGISSHQLARNLKITQKSAWFLLHRIRYAFGHENFKETFDGVVQADETFVGGKNKNRHADKKVKNSQGRSFKDKTPVLGLLHNGKVNLTVVKSTKAEQIQPIIKRMVTKESLLISDEWGGYSGIEKHCNHVVVDHGVGEYVRGAFHTNSIEGFWSIFKRGIIGIYHQVSRKHLQRYCEEFSYRYNQRNNRLSDQIVTLLQASNKRITYKELIA